MCKGQVVKRRKCSCSKSKIKRKCVVMGRMDRVKMLACIEHVLPCKANVLVQLSWIVLGIGLQRRELKCVVSKLVH